VGGTEDLVMRLVSAAQQHGQPYRAIFKRSREVAVQQGTVTATNVNQSQEEEEEAASGVQMSHAWDHWCCGMGIS
jgi:hypothetical protein